MDSEIRIGRVSSINYEAGMARVVYRDRDNSVTAEVPILTNNDEYRMPEVDQSVVVAHMSNGSSRGVLLGTVWNKQYSPKEAGKELYRKELSRKKDAAFIRYTDDEGEYLVKAPQLHLNGIDQVVFDGPEMEIAANISILLQTAQMHTDCEELLITGGEAGSISADVAADIRISQEGNTTEAVLLKLALELMEDLVIRAEDRVKIEAANMDLSAEEQIGLSGGGDVEISAGGTLRLSDGSHSITLEEIMEKLEAL